MGCAIACDAAIVHMSHQHADESPLSRGFAVPVEAPHRLIGVTSLPSEFFKILGEPLPPKSRSVDQAVHAAQQLHTFMLFQAKSHSKFRNWFAKDLPADVISLKERCSNICFSTSPALSRRDRVEEVPGPATCRRRFSSYLHEVLVLLSQHHEPSLVRAGGLHRDYPSHLHEVRFTIAFSSKALHHLILQERVNFLLLRRIDFATLSRLRAR